MLGAIQGPAELLPISSSAHLSLIPWFAGWGWDQLDSEVRKSFEIALHAGTAAALLIGQRKMIAYELAEFDRRRTALIALSFAPSAVVGDAFERQIERRLGGPGSIAAGLARGRWRWSSRIARRSERGRGDAGPRRRSGTRDRPSGGADPGVSRNGDGVNALRSPDRSFLVITHYQRLLNYIVPDFVHVMSKGRIVRSGGKELALELEERGYGDYASEAA